MRLLVAMLTATSTIELTVGMPEPVWMFVWGTSILAFAAVLGRIRTPRLVGQELQAQGQPVDSFDTLQEPSFAGTARG